VPRQSVPPGRQRAPQCAEPGPLVPAWVVYWNRLTVGLVLGVLPGVVQIVTQIFPTWVPACMCPSAAGTSSNG
jgi:hypothetical protein